LIYNNNIQLKLLVAIASPVADVLLDEVDVTCVKAGSIDGLLEALVSPQIGLKKEKFQIFFLSSFLLNGFPLQKPTPLSLRFFSVCIR